MRQAWRGQIGDRDLSLDVVRVSCVLAVVIAHVCFVALRTGPDGGLQNWTPPQQYPFFAVGTWFVQPMPLFFVVGGCVSVMAWRSAQARGEDAFSFFRTRLIRLAQPTAALFVILALGFGIAMLAKVPLSLVDAAAFGIGAPIWFVGAYLLCQAMVPFLADWHQRRPVVPLVVLATGAAAVDLLRSTTGLDGFGLLNYFFVWPFAQQLGFWICDLDEARLSWTTKVRRWQLLLGWMIGTAIAGVVASVAPYGPDMLQNQIPPTFPLVAMAFAHTCLFLLVRPALRRLAEHRVVLVILGLVGSRGMTLYLWHSGFVIGIAALFYFLPGFPQAPSALWWLTRPLVLLVVLAVVFVISLGLVRLERGPRPEQLPRTNSLFVRVALTIAGLASVIPAFLTTIPMGGGASLGLNYVRLVLGAVLLVSALTLIRISAATLTRRPAQPAP